jgi:hypothetical protein
VLIKQVHRDFLVGLVATQLELVAVVVLELQDVVDMYLITLVELVVQDWPAQSQEH